jgi:hypothetical protein
MPIPKAPDGRSDAVSMVLVLFEQLHDQVRDEMRHLDDVGLHWSPGPGANPITTIVTHMVGSEAETLRCVAGVPSHRNRESEFGPGRRTRGDVLRELDDADALIAELGPEIGPPNLRRMIALPTLPSTERRPGFTWLVGNYGHAREHVGHIQLTAQLYQESSTGHGRSAGPPTRIP